MARTHLWRRWFRETLAGFTTHKSEAWCGALSSTHGFKMDTTEGVEEVDCLRCLKVRRDHALRVSARESNIANETNTRITAVSLSRARAARKRERRRSER